MTTLGGVIFMGEITISSHLLGSVAPVIELHAQYYGRHWGFGHFFEAKVAAELSEFLRRFDPERDAFFTANRDEQVEGSIAIDGAKASTEGAHLRWFIVSDALRGQGIGNRLMEQAIGFCRQQEYPRVFLWTFRGLHSARHLYQKHGFRLVQESEGKQWGAPVLEQRFVLDLA